MKDFLLRFGSRKLLVFFVACFFLPLGFIDQETWMTIALSYSGLQAFLDWKRMKEDKKE